MSQKEPKDKEKKAGKVAKGSAKTLVYGLGLVFLMVWVFVLGVLTGRGDVNRLFQRLGLYQTDLAARLGVGPDGQKAVVPSLPQEGAPAVTETAAKDSQETKVTETAPVAGAVAAAAGPAKAPAEAGKKTAAAPPADPKRAKGAVSSKPEPDRSIASKLNFQNSLDSPARKPPKAAAKKEPPVHKEPSAHAASIVPGSSPAPADPKAGVEKKKPAAAYQVKVGTYRTAEEAEKVLADLKKKGVKVSVQPGKDKTGASFTIKTGKYATKAEAEKVTQKLKEAKLSGQIQELKP